MAIQNQHAPDFVYEDGSSDLALGLTQPQAQAAFDDTNLDAAWYILSKLQGGEIGPDRDVTDLRDERGDFVKTVTSREEFVIANTVMQTDDATLHCLTWLEDHVVPARYPLPAHLDESVDPAMPLVQMWYFPHVKARKTNWRLSTSQGTRTRAFEIVAVKRNDDPLYVVGTVDPSDETGWPAKLNDAKTDVFAPST